MKRVCKQIENHFVCLVEQKLFLFAETLEHSTELSGIKNSCSFNIDFEGEVTGKIGITSTFNLGTKIAEVLLGLDPESKIENELITDSLSELLNIIAGNILNGSGVAIKQLGVPIFCNEPLENPFFTSDFLIENEPLKIFVYEQ